MIRTLHYLKAIGCDFCDDFIHSNITLNQNFTELQKNVQKCTLCHFSKTRKHSLMERKLKNTKLMILAARSQESENESGIVLKSRQGEFLQNCCKEILQLHAEEFYFSYVFKCFSNKFDDFSLQSCIPFFWNELYLVRPKILLCLGEYAFKSLGFNDFNALRGELFSFKDFFIIASFELEFLEKNPSYQTAFRDDLQKIKGFL
ncbi:uracil-DNA glycosylase family protein [Campylobacter sp. MIT 21-1685]|uniref:uracil-DNA glycosylase family protein n=1 Tax=unclassified Campylobacter TaxID=2593542 RepID=UPI00224B6814|nr:MULTISPECIES: uracil-DNA glycosylase family protein [unclassified Campylobacter]MCX2683100.1 uracil-DNA glycosylase family protein [Campylobacter sp. MIT 21-1684]MCX2751440.1 uracil-DNA glycosylase family protein [Campylobacter sp. MIT 21-1682]MCX2807640.1 uracil-DNA glycosylase family protein [Campylobacter sp. MIT 21-1685]